MALFWILLQTWIEKEISRAVVKAVLITFAYMLFLGALLFTFIKLS